jgi:hypothetical protein
MQKYDGWIPCPFLVDFNYRVKISFEDFIEGEIVRFKRSGFERWDNAYGYAFSVPKAPNVMKIWYVYNREPSDWEQYFEMVKL